MNSSLKIKTERHDCMAKNKANKKSKITDVKIVSVKSLADEVEIKRLKKELTEERKRNKELQKCLDCKNPVSDTCEIRNYKYVLCCEGTGESWDYKVYSILFPNAFVIPYGGYREVKINVKMQLFCVQTFAIIDRDDMTEREIQGLEKNGIYTIKVRSIENLFFTDDFLLLLLGRLNIKNPKDRIIFLKKQAKNQLGKIRGNNPLLDYPNKSIINFLQTNLRLPETACIYNAIKEILETENKGMLREILLPYMPEGLISL